MIYVNTHTKENFAGDYPFGGHFSVYLCSERTMDSYDQFIRGSRHKHCCRRGISSVIGVFVLMYLGERGEPAAQPDHWEQELRKVFFILILLVSGLLFLSLLIAILLAENIWRGNAEEITAVAIVDVLILIGLLVITELFVMVNMLRKHKDTASARND